VIGVVRSGFERDGWRELWFVRREEKRREEEGLQRDVFESLI
jgi:hypothetical protein